MKVIGLRLRGIPVCIGSSSLVCRIKFGTVLYLVPVDPKTYGFKGSALYLRGHNLPFLGFGVTGCGYWAVQGLLLYFFARERNRPE